MPAKRRRDAVIDTCVLVNFLVLNRLDLLSDHPVYRFVLTGHVAAEVSDFYPEQRRRLNAALGRKAFRVVTVDALSPLFLEFTRSKRLGAGESAAIAYAIQRRLPLVIDDKRARKSALAAEPTIKLESTVSLVVLALQAGSLTIKQADFMKEEWESEHRFRLPFDSFAERLEADE